MKSTYIDIEILRKLFSGGESIRKLKDDCTIVPDVPGIYVVTKPLLQPASFLKTGTGGHFKGKDPNVEVSELETNWIDDTIVVYIGKATSLRTRLRQYMQFGKGKNVGHWGGRYIWQLSYADDLKVWWFHTYRPREIEKAMIAEFQQEFGRRPFANLTN